MSLPETASLSYNVSMSGDEKVRLGGMALENGVLVQGPTAWACAVRLPSGEVRVAARRKRFQASRVRSPLLCGPARLAEAFAVLPGVRRALPEARLPFTRPRVRAAFLASSLAVRLLRSSPRAGSLANELSTVALAILPVAAVLIVGAYILGATTLQNYGLALFVGLMSGAYSSIFIASPILAWMKEREPRYRELAARVARTEHAVLSPRAAAMMGSDQTQRIAGTARRATSMVIPRARKQKRR